jgi:hypothetical protein
VQVPWQHVHRLSCIASILPHTHSTSSAHTNTSHAAVHACNCHATVNCLQVYWLITEALRILATLLAFCAAAYVCGRVCALFGKWWQRAVVAVKSVLSVTAKSVTAGDAPEDATEASQSRRSTVCIHAINTDTQHMHTCSHCLSGIDIARHCVVVIDSSACDTLFDIACSIQTSL